MEGEEGGVPEEDLVAGHSRLPFVNDVRRI